MGYFSNSDLQGPGTSAKLFCFAKEVDLLFMHHARKTKCTEDLEFFLLLFSEALRSTQQYISIAGAFGCPILGCFILWPC